MRSLISTFTLCLLTTLCVGTAASAKGPISSDEKLLAGCVAKCKKLPNWQSTKDLSAEEYATLADGLAAVRESVPLLSHADADRLLAGLLKAAKGEEVKELLLASFAGFVGKRSVAAVATDAKLAEKAKAKSAALDQLRSKVALVIKSRREADVVTAILKVAIAKAPNATSVPTSIPKDKGKDLADLENAVTEHLACRWDKEIGTKENSLLISYLVERPTKEAKTPVLKFSLQMKVKTVFYEVPLSDKSQVCRLVVPRGATAASLSRAQAVKLLCYLMLSEEQAEDAGLKGSGWVGSFQSSSYMKKALLAIQDDRSLNACISILNYLLTDDFDIPEAARKKEYEIGPDATERIKLFMLLVKKHRDPKKVSALAKELTRTLSKKRKN